MYELILSRKAGKVYSSCNAKVLKKINSAFTDLTYNPKYGSNIKKLKGKFEGLYRYRFGEFRIVYSVDDEIKIVAVIWIGKRRDAYK